MQLDVVAGDDRSAAGSASRRGRSSSTKASRRGERVEAAFDDFRALFPAALCYTKIVPVDEVITLTLFYREDDHLVPADARHGAGGRGSTGSGTNCTS